MANSAFFAGFCLFIAVFHAVLAFPVDLSSVGTGQLNSVWLVSSPVFAVVFLFILIVILFGCVCCRTEKGFQEFRNSNGALAASTEFVNPQAGSELTIFPPAGAYAAEPVRSTVVRIDATPLEARQSSLRPASFSSSERPLYSQDWFYEPHLNFSRGHLQYVQDYGRGWFGRVVAGEAAFISPPEPRTKVIVKILHEDATATDQMFFLHEAKPHRDLNHPNILRLLGRCLETEPFLLLFESCPNGDLKTFLTQNMASAQALTEQGATLRMARDVTAGLEFMHLHKFIHTDLAARNCLVTSDLTVKIGDYGNSIEMFPTDYYIAGSVALPVRWCAPETLRCTDVTIETKEVTTLANVWTLAVVLWEICEFGKLPYDPLTDDQVIVRVLGDKTCVLPSPTSFCLYKEELYHLMRLCWNPPLQRPTVSQIKVILDNLVSSEKPQDTSLEFEHRWQVSKPNSIPKTDNTEVIAKLSQARGARVGDSHSDAPIGAFMDDSKPLGSDSPRFLLKKSESVQNISGSLERLNELSKEVEEAYQMGEAELDSWLKGVEVKNEEDEKFVRNVSEAIRNLDMALALENTSSEETSGKSSHQGSPGKEIKAKEAEEQNTFVPTFQLGGDTQSFMIQPKLFELSSLQNTMEPPSLTFTSLIFPEVKPDPIFMPSLSDAEEEIWKGRIERGEFSEKVKEKSKSIADLMVLTHIDPSDDSDEGDKERNSLLWKNPRTSLTSNNFGSDSDIRHAVLEEGFSEGLKRLSHEHKEHGRFDSLNMILPDEARRVHLMKTLQYAEHSTRVIHGVESTLDYLFEDTLRSGNECKDEQVPGVKPQIVELNKEPDIFLGKAASENIDNTGVQVSACVLENRSSHLEENRSGIPEILVQEILDESSCLQEEENVVLEYIRRPVKFVLKDEVMDNFEVFWDTERRREVEEDESAKSEVDVSDGSPDLQPSIEQSEVSDNSSVAESDRDSFFILPKKAVVPHETKKCSSLCVEDGHNKAQESGRQDKHSVLKVSTVHQDQLKESFHSSDVENLATQRNESSTALPERMSPFLSSNNENKEKSETESSVVLGPFEEHTLDHYHGVTTAFGNVDMYGSWNDHLESTLHQNQANFDSFTFQSFESKQAQEEAEPIIDMTNIGDGVWSEEENDGKLRTPDDERSSDSGFRDKGSLSESVEDACEGKYNLEDIEAELEEAFVKGAFNNEPKKNDINFEFEESKFYEDGSKNDEDISDIDGEIEYWQQNDADYFPEMSQFSPQSSEGWYLHPPEDKTSTDNDIDDEFVNALRNELANKLPFQSRSFEMEEELDGFGKAAISIDYTMSAPLTPILEEADKPVIKSPNSSLRTRRKHFNGLMESVRNIDTETFMQYLDYMVENEGKEDVIEEICEEEAEEDLDTPVIIISPDDNKEKENFEQDIKSALGYEESIEVEQPRSILFEDLEEGSRCEVVDEIKISDDLIVINTSTNEAIMLEDSMPKPLVCFIDRDEDDYTPDSISPDRDVSSSEDSSQGEAGTDINSSPDLLSDFFITPDKTPFQSPRTIPKITTVEEIKQNDEANEIVSALLDLKGNTQCSSMSIQDGGSLPIQDGDSLPRISAKVMSATDQFLKLERLHTTELLRESSRKLEKFEMSTSFMGDDDEEVSEGGKEGNTEGSAVEGSYTPDWETGSSDDDGSSSSGEFIWKDGGQEAQVKVKQASFDVDPSVKGSSEVDGAVDTDDDGTSSDSASVTDFVPSAWDSQAMPTRSALRSADRAVASKNRRVWFKKQKYHCIYEYPREPSDNEETDVAAASQRIDYSQYADWELQDDEGGAEQDEDLDEPDSVSRPIFDKRFNDQSKCDFYTLGSFDDMGNNGLCEDEEFYVSSSTRPFQSKAVGGFFTGSQFSAFNAGPLWAASPTTDNLLDEHDFTTPDSGVDDMSATTPGEPPNHNTVHTELTNNSRVDSNAVSLSANNCENPFDKFGLGVIRPSRENLTLDLPKNHNSELGLVLNGKKKVESL